MSRPHYRSHCTVQQEKQVTVLDCHWVVSKMTDKALASPYPGVKQDTNKALELPDKICVKGAMSRYFELF